LQRFLQFIFSFHQLIPQLAETLVVIALQHGTVICFAVGTHLDLTVQNKSGYFINQSVFPSQLPVNSIHITENRFFGIALEY